MAFPLLIPAITSGLSFLGGLFGNKSSQTSTTTPTIDAAYSPLQNLILQQTMARLQNPVDLSGYGASGVSQINKAYGLTKQTQDNNLTARGLASSPVAATVDATRENARAGDVASFQNSLPLLARQLQAQDLSQATGVLSLGRGATSTGDLSTGGGLGGGVTNLAAMLGYLSKKGAFGSGAQGAF